jgi:hypothetical protein
MKLVWLIFFLLAVFVICSSFSIEKPDSMEKLMKQMITYIKKERKQIEENKPSISFPVSKHKMSKAKVNPKKLSKEHEQFIELFFEDLAAYEKATDLTERKALFNNMVNSCVNCHQHECPGPLVVIKKQIL